MPQRKAAKKDLKQNAKNKIRNLAVKSKVKRAIKNLKKSIKSKDSAKAEENLKTVYVTLDKASSQKVIHCNKAARKKSRLSKLLKQG